MIYEISDIDLNLRCYIHLVNDNNDTYKIQCVQVEVLK